MTKEDAKRFVGKNVKVSLSYATYPKDGTMPSKHDQELVLEKYGDVWKLWAVGVDGTFLSFANPKKTYNKSDYKTNTTWTPAITDIQKLEEV